MTFTFTFSPCNKVPLAINPGSAATLADNSKVTKYDSLSGRFIFHSFAVETSGVIFPSSLNFIRHIGRMAAREIQEPTECERLLQNIIWLLLGDMPTLYFLRAFAEKIEICVFSAKLCVV